jgi:hypothetical protein
LSLKDLKSRSILRREKFFSPAFARGGSHSHCTRHMFTCALAWATVLLLLPLIVILWATESRPQRIRRIARTGASQRAIADRLGCSRYAVQRALAGA